MQENKQEKSPIKQKILMFLANRGISEYKFYKETGITRGILAQNNGISEDNLARFLAYYKDVSPEWLLTGNGEMIKGTISVPKTANIQLINNTKPLVGEDSIIPLYNLDVSAGLGALFASGGELLGNISVPNMPKCDGAVYVIGDSMYPLLKAGDIIAYKVVTDIQSINFGEIYIIQLENEGDTSIVVKYVKRSDEGNDHIKLVSYNKEHDPKDIPVTWIKAIARVTLSIRKFSFI